MFNDLTGAQNQEAPKVDDIFADTDNSAGNGKNSQIETRRVGLSAGPGAPQASSPAPDQPMQTTGMPSYDEDQKSGGSKGLKIAIFTVIGAIVILGGYLAYTKLIVKDVVEEVPVITDTNNNVNNVVEDNVDEDFVTPVVDETNNDTNEDELVVENNDDLPIIPGLNAPEDVDSDLDGLTDAQEAEYGTNISLIDSDFDTLNDYDEIMIYESDPLKADSDGDGLSDYEEIKVYQTDPMIQDTDGDGYDDYSEVSAGYNPNGEGKMPGTE